MNYDLIKRLQALTPKGIKPKFEDAEGWKKFQEEEGRKNAERVAKENHDARVNRIMGRSGIQDLHADCSFDTYKVMCNGQGEALESSRRYANEFGIGMGGFVFSGSPGTGKNHLAAAIANHLMQSGKSVLIVTVSELMIKFRDTYRKDSSVTESQLIDDLCRVDLLILDEIGVQHGSANEKIIINQIIDKRLGSKKPVGMLTNLDLDGMNKILGARVMDRMQMGGGLWVNFAWDSYRKFVK